MGRRPRPAHLLAGRAGGELSHLPARSWRGGRAGGRKGDARWELSPSAAGLREGAWEFWHEDGSLDEERSACGCTTIVFGGLRMQMPEKIFGNNWLELRHADSKIAYCFDCAPAEDRVGPDVRAFIKAYIASHPTSANRVRWLEYDSF